MAGTEKFPSLQRLLQRRTVRYGLLTLALLLLLFLGLQVASRYILRQWLLDNGADSVTIDEILLNPFTGRVVLDGVDIERGDKVIYRDQTLHVNLSMSSLFSRHARLQQLTVRDMMIDIHQDDKGVLRIGSYRMATDDRPQKEEAMEPWTFGAEEIRLRNVVINYRREALRLTLQVDRATAHDISSGSGQKEGSLRLSGSLNGTPLELEITDFMLDPLSLRGNIKLDDLALREIQGLTPGQLQAPGGTVAMQGSFSLQIGDAGTPVASFDGAVEVRGAALSAAAWQASGDAAWKGEVTYRGLSEERWIVEMDGALAGEAVDFQGEEALRAEFGRLTARGGLQIGHDRRMGMSTDAAVEAGDLSVSSSWGAAGGRTLLWQGKADLIADGAAGWKSLRGDGQIELRGVTLAGAGAAEAASSDSEEALQAELGRLTAEGKLEVENDQGLALSTDMAVNLADISASGAWGASDGEALSWRGQVDVSTDAAGETHVDSDGRIELRDLSVATQGVRLSQPHAVTQGRGGAVLGDGMSAAYDGDTALSGISVSVEGGAFRSGKTSFRGKSGYAMEPDGQAEVVVAGSLAVDDLALQVDERDLRWRQQRTELTADLTYRPGKSRFYSGTASLQLSGAELLQGGEKALSLESLAIESLHGTADGDMRAPLVAGGPLAIFPGELLPLELRVASTRIEDVTGAKLHDFSARRAVFESVDLDSAGGNALGLSASLLEIAEIDTTAFADLALHAARAEDFLLAATEQRAVAIAANGLAVRQLASGDLRSYSAAGAEIEALEIFGARRDALLAGIESVAARELAYAAEGRVTAARLAGREAVILDDAAIEGDPPLATLAAIDVSDLEWSTEQGTVIEEIAGQGLQADYEQAAEQAGGDEDGERQAEADEEAEEPGIPLRIGRIVLEGENNRLQYSDPTLPRTFRAVVDVNSLRLAGVDLGDVNERFSYQLEGMVDKYSPLSVSGSAAPLAKPRLWEHLLRLRGYPLANLSPFLINAIGVALTGGKLDLASQMDIRGDIIDMDNAVELQDVETRVVNEQAYSAFSSRLPVSPDTALSLIRDDGRITLSIPIEGNLADLDVSYTDIIFTALTNSITSAVQPLLAYSVLGPGGVLAYLGVELGRRLISTELPVLTYDSGQVELTEEQKSKLDEAGRRFAQWMGRQEELVYYIHPKVVPGEAGATLQEQRERQELYNLGEKRAERVRRYLLDKFAIDRDQLLIFQPGINYEENAKGTVGFMR